MATAAAVFAVLFFTAKSAKAVEKRRNALRTELTGYLLAGQQFLLRDRKEGDAALIGDVGTWLVTTQQRLHEIDPTYLAMFNGHDGVPFGGIASKSLPEGVGTGLRNRLIKLERIIHKVG